MHTLMMAIAKYCRFLNLNNLSCLLKFCECHIWHSVFLYTISIFYNFYYHESLLNCKNIENEITVKIKESTVIDVRVTKQVPWKSLTR